MNAIKDWFLESTHREQIIISAGGIILFVILLYMLVLHPLKTDRIKQLRTNEAATTQQIKVRELAGKVLALQKSGSSTDRGNLTQLLNRTIVKYGLRFEDFKPSNGDVRIRLAKANLANIFSWLDEIENGEGVQVKDITINQGPEPGTALVNLKLFRG